MMRTTTILRAALTALALVTGSVAAAQPAAKPSKEAVQEASERFKRGVKFYRDGEHRAALIEFQRAYELVPNYRVLYNLGQSARDLKDHAAALRFFERYLADGGTEIAAARRREVEGWIAELRPKVGLVTITTKPEGVEIAIDDVAAGTTPLAEPLRLNAGRRKISAHLTDHAPVQRYVDVAGSEQVTVALELVPNSAAVPPPAAPPPAPKPTPAPAPPPARTGSRISTATWIAMASTGTAGIAWGILGGRAVTAESELETLVGRRTTAQDLDDAQSKVRTFSIAADVAGGITVAGAALSVVLLVVDLKRGPEPPVRVGLRFDPRSVAMSGAF